MINLLPPVEKQGLLKEEEWKIIFISGLISFVFLISLILIFLSIDISTSSQVDAQRIVLDQRQNEASREEIKNFKDEVNLANKTLLDLNGFYEERNNFTTFLDEIARLLPSGVFLNNISINPVGGEGQFQISLSGYAPLIENVVELREKITQKKDFTQIYIPPSTWIKNKDIDFNITFQAPI